ncbi:MAG: hypothetical protein ACYS6K_28495 [Planctomycetota bacterium]
MGEVMELEEALTELEQRGHQERQLAEKLLNWSRNLELNAILALLGQIGILVVSGQKPTFRKMEPYVV